MKLWGECFTKETNQLVHDLSESLSFDREFYRQDIRNSIAHVRMLAKQGVLAERDRDDIIRGLESTLEGLDNGKLAISPGSGYEDIRSFVENTLTERIGEAGKRLYTGCSRSDQIALDMKLYTRDGIDAIEMLMKELLEELLTVTGKNTGAFMSGFTHLQKTQPIAPAHHMGAYFEMFSRDRSCLENIRRRMDCCPLGSGALAGTTYPLNREYTAELLGFDGPTLNSMGSVTDRDYPIELLSALSAIPMHLSRFCERIIIWNTNEYRFVGIDDPYSTGSFIMPQKKNPGITELIRGKSGHVYGALVSMLATMKGIPLVHSKDMQEDKELTFDAIDTVEGCLTLFTGVISSMSFRKEIVEASAKNDFTNVTDTADYLVNKGVSFKDAHGIMGQLILAYVAKGTAPDGLSLEKYRAIGPVFGEDVYGAISMGTCVEKHLTIGVPNQEAMKEVTRIYKKQLDMDDVRWC